MNFFVLCNDYKEDMAIFSALAKIHSTEYFYNTKVTGLGKNFCQVKFFTFMVLLSHYNTPFSSGDKRLAKLRTAADAGRPVLPKIEKQREREREKGGKNRGR